MKTSNKKDISKRRIFIECNGKFYKLFSFKQEKDGSIYFSNPEFANVKWMTLESENVDRNKTQKLIVTDSPPTSGKLSIHGSGMIAFRANNNPTGHTSVKKGNYLTDLKNNKLGVRHLFTYLSQKPEPVDASIVFKRSGDYSLKTEKIEPVVIIFFAIPAVKKITIKVKAHFTDYDLNHPTDGLLGLGGFNLIYHTIVWYIYKTKHMDRWPKNTHVCYHGGYEVPFFIGTDTGESRLEFRNPIYELEENKLTINL